MKWTIEIACDGLGSTIAYVEADTPGQALDAAYSEEKHYYGASWPWFPVITVRPLRLVEIQERARLAGAEASDAVIKAEIGDADDLNLR